MRWEKKAGALQERNKRFASCKSHSTVMGVNDTRTGYWEQMNESVKWDECGGRNYPFRFWMDILKTCKEEVSQCGGFMGPSKSINPYKVSWGEHIDCILNVDEEYGFKSEADTEVPETWIFHSIKAKNLCSSVCLYLEKSILQIDFELGRLLMPWGCAKTD